MQNPFKFFKKLVSRYNSTQVDEFLKRIERVIALSQSIEEEKRNLLEAEYKIVSENKNDVFISLKDFMDIIDSNDVSMENILQKCKHRKELSGEVSYFPVDAYVEDNHLVFCMDKENCERHKNSVSNKINLITLRKL